MDRLSLDQDHRERQEETRRNKPAGVTQGLKQGLTGFGMSVLGMYVMFLGGRGGGEVSLWVLLGMWQLCFVNIIMTRVIAMPYYVIN